MLRKFQTTRFLYFLLAMSSLALPIAGAKADVDETRRPWYVHGGPYTHFSTNKKYEGPPVFAGIEYTTLTTMIVGFSVFNNSFGQFLQYVYLGKSFHPIDKYPGFRFKVTGGIGHGYDGEHHDVFPIRWGSSFGLAVVPTVGYQVGALGFDIGVLGDSGLVFLVGYQF